MSVYMGVYNETMSVYMSVFSSLKLLLDFVTLAKTVHVSVCALLLGSVILA